MFDGGSGWAPRRVSDAMCVQENDQKEGFSLHLMAEWFIVVQRYHCDVRKKLCKKGRGDQTRHPQRSPLQRFSPQKEGIVVTVGRRSAAGDRADAQDAPREDTE